MSFDQGLFDWVQEALEPIGSVSMRKMMGGATLYLDGTIFAIIHGGEIWFKADTESDAIWDAEGLSDKFTIVMKNGWVDVMNYRRAPADAYDDAEVLQRWAALGAEAGARRPVKRRKR